MSDQPRRQVGMEAFTRKCPNVIVRLIRRLQLRREIRLNGLTHEDLDPMLTLSGNNLDDRSPHGRGGLHHHYLTKYEFCVIRHILSLYPRSIRKRNSRLGAPASRSQALVHFMPAITLRR